MRALDDLTGTKLGDYHLLRLLGRGAMAAVYLAEQGSLARRVAVKVLNADLAREGTYVERFQHEARSAASIVHAHIVQVYEVGVSAERHYLAQEYVPGGTLGQLVERDGPLTPTKTLQVMWQVAEALSAAAEKGLVHRDIKPDNLMLDRSGAVKVADFGLARLSEAATPRITREGITLGTPLYMSPEQVEGRQVDSRSDLYSLGVTAYHLLSGEPPFVGETALAVAVRHLNEAPPSIHTRRDALPASLADVIHRLMAKSPDERYASPSALLEALQSVASLGADEGWIDPEGSATRMIAPAGPDGTTTADSAVKLARAMRESTSLEREGKGSKRWLLAPLIGLLCGLIFSAVFRPGSLLPTSTQDAIHREPSVRAQLYLAKLVDTPEAWLAVSEFFPDTVEYNLLLAERGYATSCLKSGQFRRAMPALMRLNAREADQPGFAAFAKVGLFIAHVGLGEVTEAKSLDATLSENQAPEYMRPEYLRAKALLNGS